MALGRPADTQAISRIALAYGSYSATANLPESGIRKEFSVTFFLQGVQRSLVSNYFHIKNLLL